MLSAWIRDLSGDVWVWNPDIRRYIISPSANPYTTMFGHSRESIEELYGIDEEVLPEDDTSLA